MILFGFVQEKNLMGSLVKIYVYVSLILVWVLLGLIYTQREKRETREKENKVTRKNQREEREKRGLTNGSNNV